MDSHVLHEAVREEGYPHCFKWRKKTISQSIILETKMKDLDLRGVVWITDKKRKPRNVQIDNKCLLEQQKIEKLGELLSNT